MTDRLHDSGSANSNQTLASLGVFRADGCAARLLARDELQPAGNRCLLRSHGEACASRRIPLCVGRRERRDPADRGLVGAEQGTLRRNVGIGGMTFRPSQKLSVIGRTRKRPRAAVRTSAPAFTTTKSCARRRAIRPTKSLSLFADFTLLDNQTPLAGTNYKYQSQQESLSFLWAPSGGKNWDFQGSYSRSTMNSDIGYLDPEFLIPAAVDLSRQCAYGHLPVQREFAALFRAHAEVYCGRVAVYLLREPAHQLLPALCESIFAGTQEPGVVHRVDLLRLWGSPLSYTKVSEPIL